MIRNLITIILYYLIGCSMLFNTHNVTARLAENESDAVENLKVNFNRNLNVLEVLFKESSKPRGKILQYRTKVTSTKIDICGKRNTFNYTRYTLPPNIGVPVSILKQCGLYLIEVAPVYGWNPRKFGQSASIFYEHFNGFMGTITSNALVLSPNLVSVEVKFIKSQNACLIDGIAVSIINKNNEKDCMTKIMGFDDCDELRKSVQRSHGCPNIEFVKFEKHTMNISSQYPVLVTTFSRAYQNKDKYKIGVSRIYHQIENFTFADVPFVGEIEDCFTDCFNPGQFYSGIRSATKTGKICKHWSNTNEKSARSNFCYGNSSTPWCYTNNSQESCDVPRCSSIDYDTGCVKNHQMHKDKNSVRITWSPPVLPTSIIGYLTLLHNSNHSCEQYHLQLNKDKINETQLDNLIKSFYLSCKSGQQIKVISYETNFTNLHQNSRFVYIIPIISESKSGEIRKLTLHTSFAKSDAVENLRVNFNRNLNILEVLFKESSNPRGKILQYRTKVTSTKIDICGKRDGFNDTRYSLPPNIWIPVNILKQCGLYFIEVAPVYKWYPEDLGESASIFYEHFKENLGTMTTNALILSSNLARVLVKIDKNPKACLIDGIVVSIINKNNEKDCKSKIMAFDDCDELTKNVQRNHGCPNTEYQKFNNQSSIMNIRFSLTFQNKNKYKIGTSRIFDKIENVTFEDVPFAGEIGDCFTDCFNPGQFYFGIRSATKTGKVCKDWSNTSYEHARSNLCYGSSSTPWCYTNNSQEYCDVPQCSTIDYSTGCVKNHHVKEEKNSIRITWSPPGLAPSIIGYLILLHNSNYSCEQYHLQLNKDKINETQLDNSIKSFYLSCKSGQQIQVISYEIYFTNLHQNSRFVYIIPIISESKSGEIRKLIFPKSFAKPDVPNIISIKSESVSEMELSWEKQKETEEHGLASYYLLKIRKGNAEEERKVSNEKEGIKLEHLEMCSEYCFSLSGVNDAGSSEFSKEICSHTLAPKPGIVKLDDLKSGYLINQKLKWDYLGCDKCLKTYRVEYWNKYKENKTHISTNESSTELKPLERNAIYVVRVRSEGLMKTVNNETIGNYSDEKQFYTGDTGLELAYYNESLVDSFKSLNITWGIKDQLRGSIFEFMILLKNSSKMCQNLIHMTCDSCDEPKNQVYLTTEQKDKRLDLLKCKPVETKTFQPVNIIFEYLMELKSGTSKYSVEIYGTNLIGMHLMKNQFTIVHFVEKVRC